MAAIFTVLCGISVIILGYFIYYFSKGDYINNIERIIDLEIHNITENYDLDDLKSQDIIARENSIKGVLYAPDKTIINGDFSTLPEKLTPLKEGLISFKTSKPDRYYAAKVHIFDNDERLLIAYDITEPARRQRLMQILGGISILLMSAVIFVSYLISNFVVNGTNKIAVTAQKIMDTGDLSRRIELDSKWDDLGHMAIILNTMFERIEDLVGGIKHVSDNIAHDLRTPLTRLHNNLETLQKNSIIKSDPELQATCEKLADEADHLLNTFNALLRISRIEAQKQKTQFQKCNLSKIIEDVVELYEPVAEDKNIKLYRTLSDLPLNGDRDLLFQAFANILDNAVKYTPQGGKVSVSMEADKIIITDSGIGLNNEEKEKVFNRFYRADKSRQHKGTGLGLSLALAIIKLHGGQITLADNNPGLKVITKF